MRAGHPGRAGPAGVRDAAGVGIRGVRTADWTLPAAGRVRPARTDRRAGAGGRRSSLNQEEPLVNSRYHSGTARWEGEGEEGVGGGRGCWVHSNCSPFANG